jgi:hypothetical protein
VDGKMLLDKMELYKKAGLSCSYSPLLFQNYKIIIHEIVHSEQTMKIITLFFPEEKDKTITTKWISPKTTNHLLTRYIVHLLEEVGCVTEIQKVD